MKQILFALTGIMALLSASAQKNNVTVKASMPGIPATDWVYFSSVTGDIRDSVKPDSKGFSISMHIPEGEGDLFLLQIGKRKAGAESDPGRNAMLYLENGIFKIKNNIPSFKDAVFSGGKDAANYNKYVQRKKADGMEDTYKVIQAARNAGDTQLLKSLTAKRRTLSAQQLELDKQWFLNNVSVSGIVYPLFFSFRGAMGYTELDSLLQLAKPAAKNNLVVKKLEYSIRTDKLLGIGKPAPEFSQSDTAGKIVALKDFRGKYVLVDFWASWCVPCRVENPNVVAAFHQYKSKGFTILGVSFDKPGDHARWLKAIHDDQLAWTHVSDLKFWDNEVGKLYDIRSIPSNILIGPDGRISGRNLKGEELDKKLEELLGKPDLEKGTFIIKGKVAGARDNTWFHITYMNAEGKMTRDSVKLFAGTFLYKGSSGPPSQGAVYFQSEGSENKGADQYRSLFIEPGVIKIEGEVTDTKSLSVKGGPVQEEMGRFEQLIAPFKVELQPFSSRYNKMNLEFIAARKSGVKEEELEQMKARMELVRDSMQPIQEKIQQVCLEYFRKQPDSYITASQIRYYISKMKPDELQVIYNKMRPELKESANGQQIARGITNLRAGSPGSLAPAFADTDINGKPIQLRDFKGKYILLDFWASWCVPCRKGNPHLLQLYGRYKGKGFEIIGVSDDDSNEAAWRKAVNKDGIAVWKHVLRRRNAIAPEGAETVGDKLEAYGIHALPTKILIDPQGMIVGRYGDGGENDEYLDKKLAEIFK